MSFEKKYEEWKKKQSQNKSASQGASFDERYTNWQMRTRGDEIVGNISNRFNSWLADYDSLVKDYSSRYTDVDASTYRSDSADWLSKISDRSQSNWQDALEIKDMVNQYKNYLDPEWVRRFYNTLESVDKAGRDMVSGARREKSYWEQWGSAEEYEKLYDNTTYSQKYEGMTYADIQKALETTEGREKDWLTSNADSYMGSADAQAEIDKLTEEIKKLNNEYDEVAYGYNPEGRDLNDILAERKVLRSRVSQLDGIRDTKQRTEKIEEFQEFLPDALEWYANWNGPRMPSTDVTSKDGIMYKDNDKGVPLIVPSQTRNSEFMELGEDVLYAYLKEHPEVGDAEEYIDALQVLLDKRAQGQMDSFIEDRIDNGNFLEQIFYQTASVGSSIFGGIPAIIEDTYNTMTGNPINPYSPAHTMQNIGQTIRSETAENIEEATDWEIGGYNVASSLYSFGMSAVDSYVGGKAFKNAYLLLAGTNAASSKMRELYERGASNKQVFIGGIASGLAEAAIEKIPLDNLLKPKSSANPLQWLKEVAKQAGLEGLEEGLTESANVFFDEVIMGDKSKLSLTIKKYESGYYDEKGVWHDPISAEEATKKAYAETLGEILYATVGGMISGGMVSGPSIGIQTIQNSKALTKTGNKILSTNGGYDTLKQSALDKASASDASIGKYIEKIQPGVDALYEGNASNRQAKKTAKQVGALAQMVDTARSDLNTADFETSLKNKGMTDSEAKKGASILNTILEEGELSRSDALKVVKDQRLYDVSKELISKLDSSVNSRNGEMKLASILKNASKKPTTASTDEAGEAKTVSEGKNIPLLKDATERHYEASENGKATVKTTGKTVTIEEIANINNGKMTLKVKNEDGSVETVEADNVSYTNDGEAFMYETVAHMGVNAVVANSIVKGYNPEGGVTMTEYIHGYRDAYIYGAYGFTEADVKKGVFSSLLTDEQRALAMGHGQVFGKESDTTKQNAINEAKEKAKATSAETTTTEETTAKKSFYDGNRRDLSAIQKASIEAVEELFGGRARIRFFSSFLGADGETRFYRNAKGKVVPAPNGITNPDGSINVDLNAGDGGEGLILDAVSHELTHHAKRFSPAKYRAYAEFLVENYPTTEGKTLEEEINDIIDNYAEQGETLSTEKALDEFVAKASERMLADIIGNKDTTSLEKLAQKDKGLLNTIVEFINDILDRLAKKIKRLYDKYEPQTEQAKNVQKMGDKLAELRSLWVDMVADALETDNIINNLNVTPNTEAVRVEDTTEYSFRSLAKAAGFDAIEYEDGTKAFIRNDKKVTEVTIEDIENSPIGALINFSLEKGDIDDVHAKKQKKMFADICTLAANTNDFSMAMTFMGSAVFTGMKANSDKQYGTTYDFPSICTKTQAVIDAMSAKMKKLKRGLTADEMTKLYNDVFASGNPVPCPECYVFSRWIGIGGLLDNINTYQDYYGEMGAEKAAEAYRKMYGEVEVFANENDITFGKAKGALASKITKEYTDLKEKIEKWDNQGEKVKEADRKKLADLEKTMNTVKAMSWLEKVYFKGNPFTEKSPKVNPNYKVPTDILFDLNMGESFATQYKEAWAFRTTQGAGYGKAITPYAEAVIGEGILVTNNTSKTIKDKQNGKLNNIFLEQKGTLTKDAKKTLEKARLKQKIQAFLGGQRFQSTSDARYENASDYLIAMLEMQAMGGMVQAYTKVDGAVPAFNAWGVSTNQSLMPKNGGVDKDGNLIDTNTGGMNRDKAFENRKKFEQAGTITIGVNDIHIRVLFGKVERDFVIPYHASGGNAEMVAEFRRIQDKESKKTVFVRSTDYTRVQSDKVLSDDVLSWLGKSDEEIERIKANREARIAILTGGSPNMDVVRASKFLSDLYDKFQKGGEWEGVKLPKGKIKDHIFPNEFWDKSVSYEESKKITEDYLAYCDELGFLHRFSGLVPSNGVLKPINGYDPNGNKVQLTDLAYKYDENGNKTNEVEPFYWKVLTDRRMYGNAGQYLEQKVITLNDTTEDTVSSFAKNNTGRQYDKELSMKTAERIANGFSQKFIDSLLGGFGITDINDFVHVQKQVLNTLVSEGFFTDKELRSRTDVNEKSGMVIETNRSGIDETFNKNNFERHGKTLKHSKLATIRMLPEIIRNGQLVDDDISNYHAGKTVQYAYIEHNVVVDGVPMTVKVDIRKSKDKNKMWVHSVYAQKNISGSDVISEDGEVTSYLTADSGDRIAQDSDFVNSSDENSYSLRNTPPPKKTEKAYKLMRLVDGKLYPLFIGNNEEVSVGTWYNADSPNLSQLKNLAPGTHLVDMKTGEAITWDEYADKHVPKKNGKPTRSKPNIDDVHWANDNGYRFMHIEDKAGGKSESRMQKQYGDTRAYYNWGVNGSSKTESGEGSASLYALRPGWHFGEVPTMHQIGYDGVEGDTVRLDNQVWVEVEMSADVDYNAEAASNWGGDIPTHIPTDGYYKFATNPTQKKTKGGNTEADLTKSDWYVAGAFKVNRILSDSEADAIVENYNKKHGKNVPLDYRRNYGRVFNAETMSLEDSEQYSLRNTNASNRTLLANALESAVTNETERDWLMRYKAKISSLDEDQKKLAEINEEIREIRFTKGSDRSKLTALENNAKTLAKRINRTDKELLNLEVAEPLKKVVEREKQKAYQRAAEKGRTALQKKVEDARKTEVRTKIKNFKNKMEGMLQHPTDRQYVPQGLAEAMVAVCELINTDTPLYHKDGSINKAQEKRNLTKEKLNDLKNEYEKLKKHKDPMYSGEFDETIYEYLTDLQENFGGKNLKDMSLAELREMYETLRAIEETLRDARKLIGYGDAVDVYEAGDAIVAEQKEITKKRKNGRRNSAQQTRDKTLNYTLAPVRNVERMSGYNEDSYLVKLFKKFEKGVRKKKFFEMQAKKLFEPLSSGKNAKTYEDAIYNEVGGKKYTDINGRTFGISKMQMMQAVLSYEREVANHMNHINSGGFTFADLQMLRKGELKKAVSEEYSHRIPFALDMVEGFKEELKGDKWAQDYMATARKFFNEMAKDAINETSLALKHRIIAKDKNYIPFEVDKNFVVREITALDDVQQTINSYGMLKETKDGAPQPIIVTGLNNVLDRHIDQVGNVYGLAVEVRNFNKVWNVRSFDSVGSDPTVRAKIQENWGTEGVQHIEQAVRDIQGSRNNNQPAWYRKIKSNYIGATFFLNLSVVSKQIGSLFTATSMIRYRSPIRMLGNLVYTMANHKKISAEVDKYTATAWERRQGLSDAELQTLLTEGKKTLFGWLAKKLPTVINPSKWITAMDSAVALSLWKYAKQDTAKRTGLKGEELLKATAEFYDEVIENTQSMTDVLHRPEVQKAGNIGTDLLGTFKTDLYQMAGQLEVTAGRFNANKSKENGKALVRTATSIVSSAVWGQLMTTLFALLRYTVKHYRDEEDEELTAESWLKRQSFALTGDLVGYIFPLLGSETMGFIENFVYGEKEDVVDNIVLTAINDAVDAIYTVASSIKDGERPSVTDSKKLVVKSLQLFGIPANNILRTINAIELHAKDIANGEFLSFEAGVERNANHHAHRIVEAMASGNTEKAMNLYEEALEELALRKAKDGEVTQDELKEAKSNLKTALGKKYKEGKVDFETTTEILSVLLGMSEDDIYWQFDQWDYAVENGSSEGYAKYDDFFVAVETGKNLKAVVQVYLDNGVEAKTLASQITSHYKPLYKEMTNTERASIKGYLLNAYVLLGYKRSDKNKDIDNWLKD